LKHKTVYPTLYDIPADGVPQTILPGLQWLRFSLPFDLNHINLWLLEGADGWTIIDSGFNEPTTVTAWDHLFETQFAQKPVENIFITHFHPDHFGLGGYLAERSTAPVYMTPAEWQMVQSLTDADSADRLEQLYRPYYRNAGVDDEMLEHLINRRMGYKKIVHTPPTTVRHVHPGDTITLAGRTWQVIGGYGHSPEHASLYNADDKIFIGGDMVLPDITPNISYFPGNTPGHDPVSGYMETLTRIRATVPDDVIVLPSHGAPFKGLHTRIDEIMRHHDRRLAKLDDVLGQGPQTGYAAMQGLFAHRALKPGDIFFALGETMAHLIYGIHRGDVIENMEQSQILYRRKSK